MIRTFRSAAVAGVLALATLGAAENVRAAAPVKNDAPEMLDSVTEAQARAILGEIGVGFEKVKPNLYRTSVDGQYVVLIVEAGVITIATGFQDLGVSLKEVNTWNRSKRFAKLYLDEDNDPILMADLEINGGISLTHLKDWAKTYKLCLKLFRESMKGKMH